MQKGNVNSRGTGKKYKGEKTMLDAKVEQTVERTDSKKSCIRLISI